MVVTKGLYGFCILKTQQPFNHALDTDKTLQKGMQELAEQIPHITESDYIAAVLRLFRNAGLELSEQEFRTLLLLREKTEQLLLHKEA